MCLGRREGGIWWSGVVQVRARRVCTITNKMLIIRLGGNVCSICGGVVESQTDAAGKRRFIGHFGAKDQTEDAPASVPASASHFGHEFEIALNKTRTSIWKRRV